MCSAQGRVRFAPESRHVQCTHACPLNANSGHQASFDHFIRTAKERHWNSKTEGLCGLEGDNELNFCGLLDGEISRLFTFEDTACVKPESR